MATWTKITLAVTGVLALLYVTAIFLPIAPEERRPGTRLPGQLAARQDTDFSFLDGRTRVHLETRTPYLIRHSITAVAWAADGNLYIGCRACDTKFWPNNVARDNRVRVRIGDEIYRRRAQRLGDEARRHVLDVPAGEPLPDIAVFRMDPA